MIPTTDRLDPDARPLRDAWIAAGLPALETMEPAEVRLLLARLQRARAPLACPVARVCDIDCPGSGGPIRLRLYHPRPGVSLPVMLFFHGGGWVLNDLDSHDALCRRLARDIAVLSVDYRLAPEHPYPAAVDDALDALAFVCDHASDLQVDPSRLIAAGDSAGGTLATVVAIADRPAAEHAIRLLLLFYPALDLTMTAASHALQEPGLAVTGATMRWFRRHYLGDAPDPPDWRMSPAAADSFAGLPSCHLVSAGVDPLRDEAFAFAHRLAQDGVPVIHDHHPGQMHGFVTAALDGRAAGLALDRAANHLGTILGVSR